MSFPLGWWQTHDWGHGPTEPSCNGQLCSRGRLWLCKCIYVKVSGMLVHQKNDSHHNLANDFISCCVSFLNSSPPSVHLASQPPCWPPVAGGVVGSTGEQLLRREEPQPRLDLCPVCEGPVGALSAHLLAAGAPAQTLPHRPGIRLALHFYTATAAAATGWPQVQEHTLIILYLLGT